MDERSYTTVDKSTWGPGPWQDEPDKLQYVDEATGLDCLVVRSPYMGSLCGYVGVPEGHPWHGLDYDELGGVDVHGGLTFAGGCDEAAPEDRGICHIPAPGRPDNVWWLGFDCGHAFDVMPAMRAREREFGWPPLTFPGDTYKTIAYVRSSIAGLALQAAAAGSCSA